jgi:small-conductance mechanosensitive channel
MSVENSLQIPTLAEFLTPARLLGLGRTGGVLALAAVVLPMLRRSLRRLTEARLRPQQQMLLLRVVSWLAYGLLGSFCLSQLGFDLGVLLGAAGVFTVAMGFAAQTSVSNLISGLFLIIEQPFSVADQICVGGHTGEILSIDLLSVKLRTSDNLFVRMPNEMLLKGTVVNLTRYDTAACSIPFALAPQQDFAAVQALLVELARSSAGCLEAPAPSVSFTGYCEVSATLTLTFWAKRSDRGDLRSELQLAALKAFAAQGFLLPQRCGTLQTQVKS